MRKYYLIALLFLSFLSAFSQTIITVRTDSVKQVISKYIYGHFAEHLGHLIYGGIYIGENTNNNIPNTHGIRNDIILALKKLKVPVLRWPGGCFADTYHWKDGIGPKSKRPTIVNTNWGGVTEDNSFGIHDFLNFCQIINAEPYISGNVGSGTVQELADWVQYVNFTGRSPMSDLRRVNGKKDPWKVKFWGIGNEAWGCGGNMTAEHYADVFRTYATFMGNVSNTAIFRIASGANNDDYHWTETLMKNIPLYLIGGLALHHYSVIDWNQKGSSDNFSEDQYFSTMKKAWQMEELISKHSAIMDKYDPDKKVALIVDEWGGWYDVETGSNPSFLYQQNTMRDAMIAGITLNIFNNHSDRVRMANLAQMVNVLQAVILTNKEKMILTPTYHVMEMYNVHQNAIMLPVGFISKNYEFGSGKLPALSVSASKDSLGTIHVSLVNIDSKKQQDIMLKFQGLILHTIKGRILTSSRLQDHNTFDNPEKIKPIAFNNAHLDVNNVILTLPPFSVVVLEIN